MQFLSSPNEKKRLRWSMDVLQSSRQQWNLLENFGFQKKSKTNDSEEQQEASYSADANLRTDTTAAPAGTAAGESQPTARPGVTMIQDELTEAWDGVKDSSEGADVDSMYLSLPANWTSQQWREYLAYLIM